jgi:NAD dependent epimerase/dehydratase family enzyme
VAGELGAAHHALGQRLEHAGHRQAGWGGIVTATAHTFSGSVDAPLDEVFTWHTRQLAGDLAAHRWAHTMHPGPLTVAMTGSSGLIGSALAALLTSGGHTVIRLVRRAPRTASERYWDPGNPDPALLHGTDAVVHLAGAPIAGRFTPEHKHAIRASRITPTRRLAELAAAAPNGPSVLVTASAIGYYGPNRGDELLTEDSPPGEGFVAEVVTGWEAATDATAPNPVRNTGYAHVLGRVLHRPVQLPIPAIGPRLLLGGEGASELAEASQRVGPQRLLAAGHPFRHPQLEPALRHLLGRAGPAHR